MPRPTGSTAHRRANSRLWSVAAALLGLAFLAAFFVFRILLAGDRMPTLGDDLRFYYYPTYLATAEQLSRGTLPLWNPYQLCGVPWLAALQGGVLYPPHLLYLLLPLPIAMGALATAHLALVAFSAAAFSRRVGFAWSGVLLVAVLCTLRGRTPPLVQVPSMLEASAWLVPGCLAVLTLAERRWRRGVAWLGFATSMSVLAGYPQATVYCVYLWAALLAGLLLARRAPPALWMRAASALGAGIALGAAIAALQLLPSLELARVGTRRLEALTAKALLPFGSKASAWEMLSLVLEGRPTSMDLPMSLGAVGLALLPVALLSRRNRAVALVALVLGFLTLAFALGPATPLFDLYLLLPFLGFFRGPTRILFVTDFCFAVAAGAGLDAVAHGLTRRARDAAEGRPSPSAKLAALWGCVVLGLALGVVLGLDGRLRSALVAALLVALLVGAGVRARRRRTATVVGALVVVLALGEILSSPPKRDRLLYRDTKGLRVFHEVLDPYPRVVGQSERVWIVGMGMVPRLPPRVATVFGMRSVDDYEPANLRRQAEYFRYLVRGREGLVPARYPFAGWLQLLGLGADPAALRERSRLLDLAAARFVLIPWRLTRVPEFAHYLRRNGLRPVGSSQDTRLFENPKAVPRAFVTYRTEAAPPVAELLERLANPAFDPLALSYVEGPPAFAPVANAPERGEPARIVRDELHRVVVDATLRAPGMLVLADSYYPGWRASVDDEEVEIRAVNHLFRGVALPAGRHRVRFEYRPTSVVLGAAISGLGVAAWLLLVAGGSARKFSAPHSEARPRFS